MTEFVNQILLPFGGVSAGLIALAAFLSNIIAKRIINGELAKHKKDLEIMKHEYTQKIEDQKHQSINNLEKLKNDLQRDFLKYETYTLISKDKYQKLFNKRISVYQELLNLKNKIDNSLVQNAEYLEFQDQDPMPFTDSVAKINNASRANLMVISNELAELSNQLYEKSSAIFSNAKIKSLLVEMRTYDGEHPNYEAMATAEDDELRKMYDECGHIYTEWFKQLDKDVSKIRSILDITNVFLCEKH